MALMKYREPNHVLWQGVRPAHDGTQVCGAGFQVGAGNTIFYTVTAGKTLFLTYLQLSVRNSAAAPGAGSMAVYTAVPAFWRYLSMLWFSIAGVQNMSEAFYQPIEIPAGYTIRCVSDAAGVDARGIIWGWEE